MGDVITFLAWKRAERSPVGRVAVGPSSNRPILPTPAQPLWREVIGSVLRDQRHGQHRTLAQVAARAGMSCSTCRRSNGAARNRPPRCSLRPAVHSDLAWGSSPFAAPARSTE